MKKIDALLNNLEVLAVVGNLDTSIKSVDFISNQSQSGSIFISAEGVEHNNHNSVDEAIENGAQAVVFEKYNGQKKPNITYIQVNNARKALYVIAGNFYDNPSTKCKLVGVTGTNGKTTTVNSLFQIFKALEYSVAMISTVENKINNETLSTTHTTPTPVNLNAFLAKAVDIGVEYVFMECSSHGIEEERIGGLHFIGGIFTNLTPEHLDFHKNIEGYAASKKKFFDNLSENSFALSNNDDKRGKYMVQDTKAKVYFYSLYNQSDFKAEEFQTTIKGTNFSVNKEKITTKFIGRYNGYNLLEVYASAILLGISPSKLIPIMSNIEPPEGRLQFIISKDNICGIVDYAHTPDALENVLKTLQEIKTADSRIITVVGCGGGRDTTKRPQMAKIAVEFSDHSIFTSDNPRQDDPNQIIQDMVSGIPEGKTNFETEVDRAIAISKAALFARQEDIILLAGKGHEKTQVFSDRIINFSDMTELKKALHID